MCVNSKQKAYILADLILLAYTSHSITRIIFKKRLLYRTLFSYINHWIKDSIIFVFCSVDNNFRFFSQIKQATFLRYKHLYAEYTCVAITFAFWVYWFYRVIYNFIRDTKDYFSSHITKMLQHVLIPNKLNTFRINCISTLNK